MVDLLVVLTCIGLFLIVSSFVTATRSQQQVRVGEQTVKNLEEDKARLTREVGEWTVVAREAERKFRDLKAITDSLAGSGSTAADLARKLTQALADAKDAQVRIEELEDKLAKTQRDLKDLRQQASTSKSESERLKGQLASAEAEIKDLKDILNKTDAGGVSDQESGQIRQELLGIPGSIGNVIFVIDRSESMNRGGRWPDAKKTIQNWIRFLPVRRAAIVLFGADVQFIPEVLGSANGPLMPDTREIPLIDQAVRDAMRVEMDSIEPGGRTPTYAALRRAMDFKDIDAIILFTDGNPDPTTIGADPIEEVKQLIRAWKVDHSKARVHSVGIGEYFNESMRKFLHGVAEEGGGAFIGR